MFDLFHYSFVIRAFEAGIIVALLAPLIGIFLVLRRYALIADTLAHVSLAGVALGLLLHINPMLTALVVTMVSSIGIEKLRGMKHAYGESALALFLSGSLAIAIVILSFAHGFTVNVFSYLFGSIVTVTQADVYTIAVVGLIVLTLITLFYKELVFVTQDEDAAKVAGIPVYFINILLVLLSSLVIALAIAIIGVLLISALIVIPVLTALQFRKGFFQTLVFAEGFSLISVISGIMLSFYANIATGGTIVLVLLSLFLASLLYRKR